MVVAYALCALLLFTPYVSAGPYEVGRLKAPYGRRFYPSTNSTATATPSTTSWQFSTTANSSSYQSSLSSSSTIVSRQSPSGDIQVEPTPTKDPPLTSPQPPPEESDTDGDDVLPSSSLFISDGNVVPSTTVTSEQTACTGVLTSPVVFVTETITITETVTLPSNAPYPDTTYITPVQPCPVTDSTDPTIDATPINLDDTSTEAISFTPKISLGFAPPPPSPPPVSEVVSRTPRIAQTSTVLVTKKEPVVVVAPESKISINFNDKISPTDIPRPAPSPSMSSVNPPPSPSPTAAKSGYFAVPVVTSGGSSNPNTQGPQNANPGNPPNPNNPNTQGPSNDNPEQPSNPENPNTQGTSNANPGTPSNPDSRQGNAGPSPPNPAPGPEGVTTLTINNVPFVVNSDNIVVNSQTFNAAIPTSVAINGQVFQIDGSAIRASGRTIALPPNPASVTLAGQVFSIDPARPSQLAGTGITIPIPPNPQGSPVTIASQTFMLNPSQIIGAGTTMTLPAILSIPPTPTAVTVGGVVVSVGPSIAVIGSSTYAITAGQTPTTVVYEGQTISIGPGGLGFIGTSVALPQAFPTISAITAGGLELSIGPSVAIISGTTYNIGAGASSTVVTVGGEVLTIGPSGVIRPTQTIAPLATVKPLVVTAGGLTFSIEPSAAIISGTTYQIGPGASSRVLTIGGEVITLGPGGVILPSQTIPPLATITPSVVTADSLTFSVEPGNVVISGSTYRIGSGATPTTLVFGTETVRIGPDGIALPSTTISPPSQTASETPTIFQSAASSRLGWRTWCATMTTFLGILILL